MPYSPHPALVNVVPSNPAATTSATYVMQGLGVAGANAFTITPQVTGRLLVLVSGNVTGVNTATVTLQLSSGTGAAPANAAAVTGTQIGGQVTLTPITGILTTPFTLGAIITGLAVPTVSLVGQTGAATPVWLDVALKSSSGAASISNLTCSAVEL
jgi:hypothetical protein